MAQGLLPLTGGSNLSTNTSAVERGFFITYTSRIKVIYPTIDRC